MKLKSIRSYLIIILLLLNIIFITIAVLFFSILTERSSRNSTLNSFNMIFEYYFSELAGNLMLNHKSLITETVRAIAKKEKIGIILETSNGIRLKEGLISNHSISKNFRIIYGDQDYGRIRFFRSKYSLLPSEINFIILLFTLQTVTIAITSLILHKFATLSVIEPFEVLVRNAKNGDFNPSGFNKFWIPEELKALAQILATLWDEHKIKSSAILVAEISAQVTHDIRTPLLALEMVSFDCIDLLPSNRQILFRSALISIKEIVNNLRVETKKVNFEKFSPKNTEKIKIKCLNYPIFSLLESVFSEQQLLATGKNIEFKLESAGDIQSLFSAIPSDRFRRILSNIISNAVESFDNPGRILLKIEKQKEMIEISVEDSGRGIPSEVLKKLGNPGITYGKKSGNGLGLFNAKKIIESFKGSLNITSKIQQGTLITCLIPIIKTPSYFPISLHLAKYSRIIIVDDDPIIPFFWLDRLKQKKTLIDYINSLTYFNSPIEFQEFLDKNLTISQTSLFLIDHNFSNYKTKGTDLILSNRITSQSILVTNSYSDSELSSIIKNNKIKIIPKNFIKFIDLL